MQTLHSLETPNFSTLLLLDRVRRGREGGGRGGGGEGGREGGWVSRREERREGERRKK